MKHPEAMVPAVPGSSQVVGSPRKGFWPLAVLFARAKLLIWRQWGNTSMKKPQSSQSLMVISFCFLHLWTDEKITPNSYPKIYACRVLHRDKVVSLQSTPLRQGNSGSLSKTQWWAELWGLWTRKQVTLMLGRLWALSLTSLSSHLLSAKWSTEDFSYGCSED